jgi:hypothetical protein
MKIKTKNDLCVREIFNCYVLHSMCAYKSIYKSFCLNLFI